MSENLEQNLNDNVGEQGLEKNLNENFSQSARENLNKNAEAGANKSSYENLGESEQSPENLDKNLSQIAPKYKAQNFFKNALELSLQGVAGALIYAGKAGVWLSNASNCLKDEAQRAKLSKINEEQAKFERVACILPERVKELILERLKTKPEEVEFLPIYLAKKQSFGTFCTEYFYDARAKFNGFLYDFKIGAANGEILNLKIKSQI
ncbi:hypothetical protein G6W46_01900 [Campylobacter concisus]|uniref:hypothetical protein n=1 Tax=Campylobacter concisus TaxID=199 RepID=UPI0018844BC5|nr:hypothetical protein [Campylobacter concisus]MBE9835008.1 hypothetical protein [Campylobacter concisus]MBE9857393.1 hypothetical protein [Campylobacter concisus]